MSEATSTSPALPHAGATRAVGLLLLLGLATSASLVWTAPIDATQGVVQKILYIHVPVVLGAYIGFIVTALAGVLYLWRGHAGWDRLAASSAEVGVVFCTLVLVTGPIWAKGTWGRWWSWDARLTITVLLWFVYVAYLLLRSFTEGQERVARFAAVYGILGALLIPLNYYAIDLAGGRSMHPENLERSSLGEGMGLPFLAGMLTATVFYAYLLLVRLQVAVLRERSEPVGVEGG